MRLENKESRPRTEEAMEIVDTMKGHCSGFVHLREGGR